MRAKEFLSELKKKKVREPTVGDEIPHDYTPGWIELNWVKEQALKFGARLTDRYQLFMPRPSVLSKTNRDRRMDNLANPYAWRTDDPTKLKPQYAKWQGDPPEAEDPPVRESAPILSPGKATPPPGDNKPRANLWTSTAVKLSGNTYTSDWVKYTSNTNPSWMSPTGYLYRVKPNSLILELNYDSDAERITEIFQNLGVTPLTNRDSYSDISRNFPWDQIVKHFDAVHHYPSSHNEFLRGWDVESTAWLNSDQLELIGEVKIGLYDEDEY